MPELMQTNGQPTMSVVCHLWSPPTPKSESSSAENLTEITEIFGTDQLTSGSGSLERSPNLLLFHQIHENTFGNL
jgi:hypothetical protein